MGWPERYNPVVAFSMVINSSGVYSGISGKGISFTEFDFSSLSAVMEKKSIWPSTLSRCWAATESITVS